jgi:hypothetical protein
MLFTAMGYRPPFPAGRVLVAGQLVQEGEQGLGDGRVLAAGQRAAIVIPDGVPARNCHRP